MTEPLDKELVKSWDDVRHRFDDLLKRDLDGHLWHRRILERYKEGRLVVHLHAVVSGRAFCWECRVVEGEAQRTPTASPNDTRLDAAHPLHHFDHGGPDLAEGQEGEPVFVVVRQLMEPPQRFIPSVVRLRPLDLRNSKCGELSLRQTVQTVLQPRLATFFAQREGGDLAVLPLLEVHGRHQVTLGELPDDV